MLTWEPLLARVEAGAQAAPVRVPHPADLRETLRDKLRVLPTVARGVYNRSNLSAPDTPLLTVVETVLYHFDARNRARVAAALDLSEGQLTWLLVGAILGAEEL